MKNSFNFIILFDQSKIEWSNETRKYKVHASNADFGYLFNDEF